MDIQECEDVFKDLLGVPGVIVNLFESFLDTRRVSEWQH